VNVTLLGIGISYCDSTVYTAHLLSTVEVYISALTQHYIRCHDRSSGTVRKVRLCFVLLKGKGKRKVHPRTGHDGLEGEQRYRSTLPLTSALDGVGGQRHAPAVLTPGKTRYPFYMRLVGSQGRSGRVRKISPSAGIRSPDHPARSESLYRLRYPGPSLYHLLRQCMNTSHVTPTHG